MENANLSELGIALFIAKTGESSLFSWKRWTALAIPDGENKCNYLISSNIFQHFNKCKRLFTGQDVRKK